MLKDAQSGFEILTDFTKVQTMDKIIYTRNRHKIALYRHLFN